MTTGGQIPIQKHYRSLSLHPVSAVGVISDGEIYSGAELTS